MKIFITSLLCLAFFAGQAQTKKDQLRQLDVYFFDEDFENVLKLSKQLEQEYPEESRHLYHKMIAYHLLNRGGDISDLLTYENSEAKVDKFYNYWLGRVHMSRYELEDAIEHFQAFVDLKTYKSDVIRNEAKYLIKWAKIARESYENPNDYEIEHLPKGINSEFDDLSPAFFAGHKEIVFASDRITSSNRRRKDFTVYHASKQGENWSAAEALNQIGKLDYKNAKIEIIEQDAGLYFYKEDNNGSFFSSHYDQIEGWGGTIEFDRKLRTQELESHFFINDAKDMVMFAKGSGDRHDIFQMNLIDGDWTDPKPIAGAVNGEDSDEESPFVSHDGQTLYYSSNRDGTLGGYDIFKSEWNESKQEWGQPINMGFPINTLDDEVNFELTPSDQSGYLASNRLHSLGGYDIYYFHKESKIEVKGLITDQSTGAPVPFAEIKFHPQTYEDEAFVAYTDELGNFSSRIFNRDEFHIEVFLKDSKIYDGRYTSYVPTDATFLTLDLGLDLPEEIQQHSNYLALYEGAEQEENVSLEMIGNKFRGGQKAVVNNIYFDFQSYHLEERSAPVLESLLSTLTKYPNLEIEIAGHTDNVGSEETNLTLSTQRAQSVREYLVNLGIDESRLKARGYGDSRPLASNDDEAEGRELNRRIEIIAIEESSLAVIND